MSQLERRKRLTSQRGAALMNALIIGALVVLLASVSTEVLSYMNKVEKKARLNQVIQTLETNISILLNSPYIYDSCSGGVCAINHSVYALVRGETSDPSQNILYRRTLPFAQCPTAAACGLRAEIISPAPGSTAAQVKFVIRYEGSDLPVSPRETLVAVPEIASRISNIGCPNRDSEFFSGVDLAGAPICTHMLSSCSAPQFFRGFDPVTRLPLCGITAPATPPLTTCPAGTFLTSQAGPSVGGIGMRGSCQLPSNTTVECPGTNTAASSIEFATNNSLLPTLNCSAQRKGL